MLVGIMTAKGSSSRKIWKVGGLVSVVLGRTPSGLLIYQEGAQGYTEMLGGGFPSRSFQVRTQQAVFVVKSLLSHFLPWPGQSFTRKGRQEKSQTQIQDGQHSCFSGDHRSS